jgi:predicted glycosyltransferase
VIPTFANVTYPLATHVVSPNGCDNGKWNKKTIRYSGYHKLAYLHPNQFKANRSIVHEYFNTETPYFIIRLAQLNAHHDEGATGISNDFMQKIITILQPYGRIFITAERPIPEEFREFQLKINPLDIHHLLAFSSLYIGDSQSMAVEAAVLGTPNLRISSFSGKISVLEELEHRYQLTTGIHPKDEEKIFEKIQQMINNKILVEEYQIRRKKMLEEKIDVTSWLTQLFHRNGKI